MKRTITTLLLLLPMLCLMAQPSGAHKKFSTEEYRNRQKEFLTKAAGLTEAEASAFFPIYFELQREKYKINREFRHSLPNPRNQAADSELTEEKAAQLVDAYNENKLRCDELDKKYYERFKTILPAKKLLKIQMAENAFQRQILRDMQNGGHQHK